MTTLLVDIGNTRVKWAWQRGVRLSRMHALAHGGGAAALRSVVRSAPRAVNRVLAVCVAGAKLERALDAAVRARFGLEVEFVRSARSAAKVRNGYRDTWRLGADRWVGIVGAHSIAPGRSVVIANIGTALTIDAVAASGRHLGGAIVPGPVAMVTSMLAGTHGIARRARGASSPARPARGLFARDTARGLEAGACNAAGAVIDRAVTQARAVFGAMPLLLLTGGAAPALRPFLRNPVRLVPNLVLRGLAVLARS